MSLFRFKTEIESEISKKSLLHNVNWFISLRWLAIIFIFATTFIARQIFKIDLDYTVFYLIGLIVLSYNTAIFLWFKYKQKGCTGDTCIHRALIFSHIQIMLDMIALGFLIHYSGGIENPFVYVFIFHPIFASIILSTQIALFYALVSVAIVGILSIGEHTRAISHYHITEFLPSENIDSFLFTIGSLATFTIIQFTAIIITSIIIKDIRKKQIEIENIKKELEDKNDKLKKKDEMRLLFLASATHDLKSPLNTITSYIQSLMDGYLGNISEEQKKIMQRILSRINGLRQLISDVLILGEFEMGEEKEIKREEFDIIKLLSESIEEFKPQSDQKKIQIIFEKDVESCIISADPLKIDEVIHNYISNAIKYNKENGLITIKAETNNDWIKISFIDTGIGIKKEDLPRLYTDFFRSTDAKKSGIEGTGLGLGITRRIIERYGGRVGADSNYMEGSTFYFELPIYKSEKS